MKTKPKKTPRKPGRPRLGKNPRVVLSCSIDPATKDQIEKWCKEYHRIDKAASAAPPGIIIDHLANFGRLRNFGKILKAPPTK